MSASSVSGVGVGEVGGNNKGNSRMSLGVEHLIGVRVYDAGVAVLNGASPSVSTVTFAKPLDNAAHYTVLLTGQGATASLAANGYIFSNLTTTGFTITSANGATGNVSWVLIRINY